MNFVSSTRAAEDKGIVESHLWCPNDLTKLWDRLTRCFLKTDKSWIDYRALTKISPSINIDG